MGSIYNRRNKTPKQKFEKVFKEIEKHRPYVRLIPLLKRMIAVRRLCCSNWPTRSNCLYLFSMHAFWNNNENYNRSTISVQSRETSYESRNRSLHYEIEERSKETTRRVILQWNHRRWKEEDRWPILYRLYVSLINFFIWVSPLINNFAFRVRT